MDLITNTEQLIKNIETIENYLTEGDEEEQYKASCLIKKGSCLISYNIDNEVRFAPSRFLGYIDNTLSRHIRSPVDGSKTNVEINRILDRKPLPDQEL